MGVLARDDSDVSAGMSQPDGKPAPAATPPKGLALVTITSPSKLAGQYLGRFGSFTGSGGLKRKAVAVRVRDADKGCTEAPAITINPEVGETIFIVDRGNCTFELKAWNAEKAGASGIMVVIDTDELMAMGRATNDSSAPTPGIVAFAVQHTLGQMIDAWAAEQAKTQDAMEPSLAGSEGQLVVLNKLQLEVEPYVFVKPSLWQHLMDPSLAVEVMIATSLVVAGAYYAASDLLTSSPFAAPPKGTVLELQWFHSLGFCISGSVSLVLMFFLMKYLIYVIIFAFCTGASFSIVHIGSSLLGFFFPATRRVLLSMPDLDLTVHCSDVLAGTPAAGLLAGFLWFRNTPYGFLFQDTLGAAFLCTFQRSLRLPSLRVAVLLLSAMFFFDIFWVFLSPWIFQKSVMLEVAQGGGTGEAVPMLMKVPSRTSTSRGERMLGFGDVALPGLLISYLLRYDLTYEKARMQGYFSLGTAGYAIGLILTMFVNIITEAGQPALLYLVPATLGPVFCLSCWRGEMTSLMEGFPEESTDAPTPSVRNIAAMDSAQVTYRHRGAQPREGGATELAELMGASSTHIDD